MTRQVLFYANGETGSSNPVISIQKQSIENIIRVFLEVNLLHHVDSQRVQLKSNFVCCVSHLKCTLGCHRVIRRDIEREVDLLLTSSQLEDEALGLVKDGWTMFEIQIKLFNVAEFDREMKRISRPLDRQPRRWKGPDPHELMHLDGSVFEQYLPASMAIDCRGKWKRQGHSLHFHSEQVQVLRHIRGLFY